MTSGMTAQELAQRLHGELEHCPPDRLLSRVQPLDEAMPDAVSFLANPKYAAKAQQSQAGLILAGPDHDLGDRPVLRVAHPYWGFAQAIGFLHPEPAPEWTTHPIHPTAQIGAGCRLAPGVTVGARTVLGANCVLHPGVHVGEDCVLGAGCELFSGVVLYRRTQLGARVRIHANTVLGSDGYGYVLVQGRHEKVPQVGWVEVGDDVEFGAGVTVDRGVLGPTRIAAGTKIDNLVQIAHNVRIGQHCLVVSQVGISGSSELGDYVTLGGKVGVAGHLKIGAKAMIAAASVVAKDVPEGAFLSGNLARPYRQWAESQAALNRLPALMKKLRKDRE